MQNYLCITFTYHDAFPQALPCIRLSKEGVLLAVAAVDNTLNILGNVKGCRLVEIAQTRTLDPYGVIAGNVAKVRNYNMLHSVIIWHSPVRI